MYETKIRKSVPIYLFCIYGIYSSNEKFYVICFLSIEDREKIFLPTQQLSGSHIILYRKIRIQFGNITTVNWLNKVKLYLTFNFNVIKSAINHC